MTNSKIKMKRMLIAVALCVQNVITQWFARMLPTALVILAKTIHVLVSVWFLLILIITSCLISAPETCNDQIKNQDETDVDCGGIICLKCNNTRTCKNASDCLSNNCKNNTCVGKCLIFVNFNHYKLSHFSPRNMQR